jgi:hypothetical protein
VSPVRYEVGFYIPEGDILHSRCRKYLKSYAFLNVVNMCEHTQLSPQTSRLPLSRRSQDSHREVSIILLNRPHALQQSIPGHKRVSAQASSRTVDGAGPASVNHTCSENAGNGVYIYIYIYIYICVCVCVCVCVLTGEAAL